MANIDIKKALRQQIELDDFMVDGFSVNNQPINADQQKPGKMDSNNNSAKPQAQEELSIVAMDVEQCRACPLGKLRTNPVPGEGSPNARLVFVGEGPGADEDKQGRPFVGRAGVLLNKMITAMGLKREDVFICNVVKCRPPENRTPTTEEIQKCYPFLARQLEIINPAVIVTLGAPASHTLLKTSTAIGQIRGTFQDFIPFEGAKPIKLMPTYHPAYLLRNYSDDNRRKVWQDLQEVMKYLGMKPTNSK